MGRKKERFFITILAFTASTKIIIIVVVIGLNKFGYGGVDTKMSLFDYIHSVGHHALKAPLGFKTYTFAAIFCFIVF